MTGTLETLAARSAAPCSGWRKTMVSAKPLMTLMLSSRVSPFTAEENCAALSVVMTWPPSFSMPASKEKRVRVEGS